MYELQLTPLTIGMDVLVITDIAPMGEGDTDLLSTIVVLALSFAILGLLLGLAASFDNDTGASSLPENIDERDPVIQQRLFEECISDQKLDGELTQEEYDRCAYSIYG